MPMKPSVPLLVVLCGGTVLSFATSTPVTVASIAERQPPTAAASQAPLQFDLMTYDERSRRLVLVNAYREPKPELAQLWTFDGKAWARLNGAGPSMRTNAAAAYDSRRHRLVLHGGVGNLASREKDDRRGDTWEWDGERWHQMTDTTVGMRDHHAMAYDAARGKTVMYGGVSSDRTQPRERWEMPSDTWTWNGSRWTKEATEGPPARVGVSLVYDGNREEVLLFGGSGQSGRLNEMWAWNGRTWRKASERGPSTRTGQAMVFDRRAGIVLLFGGNAGGTRLDDFWQWDGERWTEIAVTGLKPGARNGASMVYDTARQAVVLYGGFVSEGSGYKQVEDMWEWDGKRWQEITASR